MEVLHKRRGHACDGLGPYTPLDGLATLNVRTSSTVAGLAGPIYGTDRIHVVTYGHVFLDEVDLLAIQTLHVEDDRRITSPSRLAHESLDTASIGNRTARQHATAAITCTSVVALALSRNGRSRPAQGARLARLSVARPLISAIRRLAITSACRQRPNILPLPYL